MKMFPIFLILIFSAGLTYAQSDKLVDILEKSTRKINKIKTLKGDYYINYGSITPGDTSVPTKLHDRFVLRKKAGDTIFGMWFQEKIINLQDTADKTHFYYDGWHLYETTGDGYGKEHPLETAGNNFVVGIFNEMFQQAVTYHKKITWPDSLYSLHEDTVFIGKITLQGDTLINGENCHLIRNYRKGGRPKFNKYYEHECLLAVSKRTFIPVWLQTHFKQYKSDHTPLIDQVCHRWLAKIKINPPVNDRAFSCRNLILRQETEIAKLEEGGYIPDWEITTTDGKKYSNANLQAQVYIMAFSYIGCAGCQFALPEFADFCKKYKDNPRIKIFYLNSVDGPDRLKDYARQKSLTCKLSSISPDFAAGLGVKFNPYYYVIDKTGKIITIIQGYPGEKGKIYRQLEKSIEKTLGG